PGGSESGLELARIGAVESEQLVGRAELAVKTEACVVDDRDAADRGRDRDGEERHDEELLAPLAAEHAPGPAGDGAPSDDAAGPRLAPRRGASERGHVRSPAARIVS